MKHITHDALQVQWNDSFSGPVLSSPQERKKHSPDEDAQFKQIKYTVIHLMWCFVSRGPFQVVVEKERDSEREETTAGLLFKVFVTEELKKGEKKKDMTSSV